MRIFVAQEPGASAPGWAAHLKGPILRGLTPPGSFYCAILRLLQLTDQHPCGVFQEGMGVNIC